MTFTIQIYNMYFPEKIRKAVIISRGKSDFCVGQSPTLRGIFQEGSYSISLFLRAYMVRSAFFFRFIFSMIRIL